MTKNEILVAAKALEPHERLELMEDLRQLVDDELTAEQIAEARRRADALDRGDVVAVPGEQVMRELRERFRR